MASPQRGRSGDKAVAYFAAAFVLAGGLAFSSVAILLFSAEPMRIFAICGGLAVGALIVIWLIQDHRDGRTLLERYGGLFGLAPEKRKVKVKVKRVKASDLDKPKAPPTAEEIRELRDGVNTWVPSSGRRHSDDER